MNRNRIRNALEHIDELIISCDREKSHRDLVPAAREGLAYLKHIVEAAIRAEENIEAAADAVNIAQGYLVNAGGNITSEPDYPGISLGY